jgi:hypothetical protein
MFISPISIIALENTAQNERYVSSIFDNKENTLQIEMNKGARGIWVKARAFTQIPLAPL